MHTNNQMSYKILEKNERILPIVLHLCVKVYLQIRYILTITKNKKF